LTLDNVVLIFLIFLLLKDLESLGLIKSKDEAKRKEKPILSKVLKNTAG
jgi:hypothetical protein